MANAFAVAEICKPRRRGIIGNGLSAFLEDYEELLAKAHFQDKKTALYRTFRGEHDLLGMIGHLPELMEQRKNLKDYCLKLADSQIYYVLKFSGIHVCYENEGDSLCVPEEKKHEARELLEDFVRKMNDLLSTNHVGPEFAVNEYWNKLQEP